MTAWEDRRLTDNGQSTSAKHTEMPVTQPDPVTAEATGESDF
jgi:hypothetical protein